MRRRRLITISKVKKYLSDLSLSFQGLILLCIDRAMQKDPDLNYKVEIENEILKARAMTGAFIADEVIILESLRTANRVRIFGLTEEQHDKLLKNYAQLRNK